MNMQLEQATGRCAVCGVEVGSKVHWCERCDTPHHQDCWDYNGRCGIFGCSPDLPRPLAVQPGRLLNATDFSKIPVLPDEALNRSEARQFGAFAGMAAVLATLAVGMISTSPGRVEPALYGFAIPAAILGWWAGPNLSHRDQIGRISFYGILGPGLTMCGLTFPLILFPPWAPCVMIYSLITVPLALPCAYLTARFNDPRLTTPSRQAAWLDHAFRAFVFGALLALVSCAK